ncbi:MAG: IS3 family transposase, partial [Verrucomicrobia bacterium]|nr:IS3 family transposase [Verrucomicrobiota bacterium]
RSGYYQWAKGAQSQRESEESQLMERIEAVFVQNQKRYGSPRVTQVLRAAGRCIGKNRVARLMRQRGLVARKKRAFRPKTTVVGNRAEPNRIAGLKPQKPDQIWVSDITYVATAEGWLYLAVILDLFSRRVVGWKMAENLEADLVKTSLQNALLLRQPQAGLVFHSDRGSQYMSHQVFKPLEVLGANRSMSGAGNCYDNAKCEAFFSTLKTECFPMTNCFASKAEARRTIFEYIEIYYNNKRLHSALGYQSPYQYETQFQCVVDNEIQLTQLNNIASEDRALRGRTSSADATLHTAGEAASGQPAPPRAGTCWSKLNAKNPRGAGGQSHPIFPFRHRITN